MEGYTIENLAKQLYGILGSKNIPYGLYYSALDNIDFTAHLVQI